MNIALGRNTAENKSTTDFITYKESLTKLKEGLIKLKRRDPYFVVQSRKGPKVLELLFSEEEMKSMKILTEHALPFLFPILAKDRSKNYLLILIDDAIYYGTTMENLALEIKNYANSFNVKVHIEIYTAIKAKWSKDIRGVDIHTKTDEIGKGYEHYFVNLLMSDIRSIPTSMEVEFPIITYQTNKHINKSKLIAQLNNHYKTRGRLYDIEQYSSETFNEKGVERFSILLDNDTKASFSKMRFYIGKNAIRVAFISPHLIPNNISAIDQIFERGTESVKKTWNSIVKIVNDENVKLVYGGSTSRNRQRTLIVAANYLLSLYLYFKENAFLQKTINKLTGNEITETSLDEQQLQLRYIFFDDDIILNILSIIDEYKNSPKAYLPNMYSFNQSPSRHQIFETPGYPPDSEKEKLQDFNARMLNNCSNINEKLSALFFNQTTLIEKWSRQFGDNTSNRLKFGYNFKGLLNALEIDYINKSLIESNSIYRVHQWIDRRIDQGCIVPQYIIDNERGQWDRVFRPGENEEAILSTLTRFVAYVINSIKKEFNVQTIPELFLKKILCVIAVKYIPNLQDLLRIKMVIQETGLSFLYEDDHIETNKPRDIVSYLKDMLVLENIGNHIDLSKRFVGTEQVINTTMSEKTRLEIASNLSHFHTEMTLHEIDFLDSFSLCNYNLKAFFTQQQENAAIEECLKNLTAAIEILLKKKDELAKKEAKKHIYNAFYHTTLFLMPKSFFEDPIYPHHLYEDENWYIYINQKRFSRINFVINILLFVFYSLNTDMLIAYINAIDDEYAKYLDSNEFLDNIKNAITKGKSITQIAVDQGRMKYLLEYVNKTNNINE